MLSCQEEVLTLCLNPFCPVMILSCSLWNMKHILNLHCWPVLKMHVALRGQCTHTTRSHKLLCDPRSSVSHQICKMEIFFLLSFVLCDAMSCKHVSVPLTEKKLWIFDISNVAENVESVSWRWGVSMSVSNCGHQWLIIHHFLWCVDLCVLCTRFPLSAQLPCSPCVWAAPALCFPNMKLMRRTVQAYREGVYIWCVSLVIALCHTRSHSCVDSSSCAEG